jgi:hypothetical protein
LVRLALAVVVVVVAAAVGLMMLKALNLGIDGKRIGEKSIINGELLLRGICKKTRRGRGGNTRN